MMHLCLACYRDWQFLYARAWGRPRSALEHASAAADVFELYQAADDEERLAGLLAAEGCEHAHVVADRSHRRAQALPERLASGGAAQVVVARAGRLGHDLQLARVRFQLEHALDG